MAETHILWMWSPAGFSPLSAAESGRLTTALKKLFPDRGSRYQEHTFVSVDQEPLGPERLEIRDQIRGVNQFWLWEPGCLEHLLRDDLL